MAVKISMDIHGQCFTGKALKVMDGNLYVLRKPGTDLDRSGDVIGSDTDTKLAL